MRTKLFTFFVILVTLQTVTMPLQIQLVSEKERPQIEAVLSRVAPKIFDTAQENPVYKTRPYVVFRYLGKRYVYFNEASPNRYIYAKWIVNKNNQKSYDTSELFSYFNWNNFKLIDIEAGKAVKIPSLELIAQSLRLVSTIQHGYIWVLYDTYLETFANRERSCLYYWTEVLSGISKDLSKGRNQTVEMINKLRIADAWLKSLNLIFEGAHTASSILKVINLPKNAGVLSENLLKVASIASLMSFGLSAVETVIDIKEFDFMILQIRKVLANPEIFQASFEAIINDLENAASGDPRLIQAYKWFSNAQNFLDISSLVLEETPSVAKGMSLTIKYMTSSASNLYNSLKVNMYLANKLGVKWLIKNNFHKGIDPKLLKKALEEAENAFSWLTDLLTGLLIDLAIEKTITEVLQPDMDELLNAYLMILALNNVSDLFVITLSNKILTIQEDILKSREVSIEQIGELLTSRLVVDLLLSETFRRYTNRNKQAGYKIAFHIGAFFAGVYDWLRGVRMEDFDEEEFSYCLSTDALTLTNLLDQLVKNESDLRLVGHTWVGEGNINVKTNSQVILGSLQKLSPLSSSLISGILELSTKRTTVEVKFELDREGYGDVEFNIPSEEIMILLPSMKFELTPEGILRSEERPLEISGEYVGNIAINISLQKLGETTLAVTLYFPTSGAKYLQVDMEHIILQPQ